MALPDVRENDLLLWFQSAEPGAKREYHRGFLARDRELRHFLGHPNSNPSPQEPCTCPGCHKARTLDELADMAYRFSERGWVHLYQVRHKAKDYSYMVVKADG